MFINNSENLKEIHNNFKINMIKFFEFEDKFNKHYFEENVSFNKNTNTINNH